MKISKNSAIIFWLLNSLWLLALVVLPGCHSTKTICRETAHVVLVNHSGKSLDTTTKAHKEEELAVFQNHLAAITNGILNDTNCLVEGNTKQILIYVHGGLNGLNQSLAHANAVMPKIAGAHYYPLMINWDSEFGSSYLEALFFIRQGQVHEVGGFITFPFYLAADLGRAITRAPVVWSLQFYNDISTVRHYDLPKVTPAARQKAMEETLPQSLVTANGLKISIGRDSRPRLDKVTHAGAFLVTFPFKLVTAPLIDAFGKTAWDSMERRTQTMFRFPTEFKRPDPGDDIKEAQTRLGQPAEGAVSRLMESLEAMMKNDPAHRYAITIVGHSMGTIVANEIIQTYPRLPYTNIVYMAAACSVSEFQGAVIPYLRQSTNTHFYNLTLHPVAEAREAQWTFMDLTPRGSLLVWIDNFLSNPRTIPERTLGKWDNVISTTALIPKEVSGQIRMKAFSVGPHKDLPDNPQTHGDFSDQAFWNPAFWTKPAP